VEIPDDAAGKPDLARVWIKRVNVSDEEIDLENVALIEDHDTVTAVQLAKAIENTEWPAWQFGW
jgi:hypothetical protein